MIAHSEKKEFQVKQSSILSGKRLELTKQYCRIHYGNETSALNGPKLIVIHYTAFATLEESRDFMAPDELSTIREDIRAGGTLNVGAHYLIDRNGDIYQLLPDDIVGRHTIGFNHVSLSLENVGLDKDHLTAEQVEADAFLINRLAKKYPSIEYLIGHYEYADNSLPHYSLFGELDASYAFTIKQDPGVAFMADLRKKLADRYGLVLKN